MSDFGNIYGSFEAGENALKEKDYITAAENFWWTEQYFRQGEFPIYDADLQKMAETARNLRYEITRHHLFTAKLSKSTFVMGKQCTKQLWLHKYKYSERVVSEQLQNAFDRGHNIGEMAQHLFPYECVFRQYCSTHKNMPAETDSSFLSALFSESGRRG